MKSNRLFSIIFAFAIVLTSTLSAFTLTVSAEVVFQDDVEQKIYSRATIEGDFADNRVMVVMNHSSSMELREYGVGDFSEINAKSIVDLSSATREKAMVQLEKINSAFFNRTSLENETIVSYKKYNQVICLDLEETGKDKVLEAIKKLEKREDVLCASPDYAIYLCSSNEEIDRLIPQDEHYEERQSAYANLMKLPEAWAICTGSSSIKVGVIDSGIDGEHPDLSDRIDVDLSRDFTNGTCAAVNSVEDPLGHGTHVAGIIGAKNDDTGVCGVCWNVTLVSLRITDETDRGYSSNLALAIDYAEENDIPILNFSGSWAPCKPDYEEYFDPNVPLERIISNYSGLFVCAAGNRGEDNDDCDTQPANLILPNLITVGASTWNDQKWYLSNHSETKVDIFATGEDIYSAYANSTGYIYADGSSMAAPFVAGVAALMLAHNPNLKPHEIKCIIMRNIDCCVGQFDEDDNDISHLCCNGNCHTCTCDDGVPCENCIGAFKDDCVSGGRLNAYKALSDAIQGHYYACDLEGTTHSVYCEYCGYVCEEVADFGTCANTGSALTHRVWCDSCEMEYDAPHRFAYTNISATSGHTATCEDCGYACTQAHTITSYTNLGALLGHKAACNKCDYSRTEAHSWTISGGVNKCRYCGALRSLDPGFEIMSGKNEEETE